ncbi:unnamed protein product [Linum trigynum]|uniref:Uncharacterized protein n=1 Tax=Linum trigynum TaxID=586398 RepID=A0AAV2FAY4_9ROSI
MKVSALRLRPYISLVSISGSRLSHIPIIIVVSRSHCYRLYLCPSSSPEATIIDWRSRCHRLQSSSLYAHRHRSRSRSVGIIFMSSLSSPRASAPHRSSGKETKS